MSSEPRIRAADLLYLASLCGSQSEGVSLYMLQVEHKHGTNHYLYPDCNTAIRDLLKVLHKDNDDPDCRWDKEEGAALLSGWDKEHATREPFPDTPGEGSLSEQIEQYNQRLAPVYELLAEWGELTNQWWSIFRLPIYQEPPEVGPGTFYAALGAATSAAVLAKSLARLASDRVYDMLVNFRLEALSRETLYPEEAEVLRKTREGGLPYEEHTLEHRLYVDLRDSLTARGYITRSTDDTDAVAYTLTEKGTQALAESSAPPAPAGPNAP